MEVYDLNVDARRQLTAMAETRDMIPVWRIVAPAPADELLGYYREAEAASGVGWNYLAAINLIETRLGSVVGPSSAGAQGPMQFLPSTFAGYADGGDIYSPRDSIWRPVATLPPTASQATPIKPSTGTTMRINTCGRSTITRRSLPSIPQRSPASTVGSLPERRPRVICCCPSATHRRRRSRSRSTSRPTRSDVISVLWPRRVQGSRWCRLCGSVPR